MKHEAPLFIVIYRSYSINRTVRLFNFSHF